MRDSVNGKRVFVGLSGGVDSAVTAALLQKAGAVVTGVFIKGWYPPDLPCTWAEDRRDAMRVAAHLQIPFVTLDASQEYKKAVIEYLITEYGAGRTPNPDIMCNREVKFGAFYAFAKEHGADHIATGHYARIQRTGDDVALLRGVDADKDQSYFLFAVPQRALADTVFPLGELHKKEVRALAKKFRLPVATKRDSQGVCFLGPVSMEEFLRAELDIVPGTAVDESGATIGTHDGALLYTLGARVPITGGAQGPWYVLRKDVTRNLLVVSRERKEQHVSKGIRIESVNQIGAVPLESAVVAQMRYHGPQVEGVYDATEKKFIPSVPLSEPAAPGQSLVLYTGERCHGGGIIAL